MWIKLKLRIRGLSWRAFFCPFVLKLSEMQNARTRQAIIGILSNVPRTRRKKVADLEKSVRLFIQLLKRQARRRKSIRSLRQRPLQSCAIIKKGDELPEPTVGFANENRSILKKNGERSPRALLELEKNKDCGKMFLWENIQDHLWELSRVCRKKTLNSQRFYKLRTEIQTTRCGWKMGKEKQLGDRPSNCTDIAFQPKVDWATASTSIDNP